MIKPYDIVTFDCYGTLIDWEEGIAEVLLSAARRDGIRLDRETALADYARIEPQVESENYQDYRAVLAETARRVAAGASWRLPPERTGILADSLPGWSPFPDATEALERLKRAGFLLGILSNIDDDLLDMTRRRFPVPFDLIVTARQVRSYKPAPAHFAEARNRIGGDRWLHAAQSHFHDIVPAMRMGIPAAWINRKGEALPAGASPPDFEVRTLSDLADRLC
ncbi:MAG TPA: HAD-IA family hydrolase [Candidatus Polarisedimenticolia bacterium]|nr:HAD-IA family hydrolase [Candidatus Polarisedimenticolia bacterium]